MGSIRNIAFTVVTIFAIGITLATACCNTVGITKMPNQSYLEGRLYQKLPELTMDSIVSKTYQDDLNQFFADQVPYRNTVLLANAGLQRSAISLANTIFAYPAYPTFFGSYYIYCPQYEAVIESPSSTTLETPELLGKSADSVNTLIEACPEVNWAFALVDRSRISRASPAHDLIESPADYSYYENEFFSRLSPRCTTLSLSNEDAQSYFVKYFKSDHHWQIDGALEAYESICKAFGRTTLKYDAPQVAYAGPFYGSEARSGLLTSVYDSVKDIHVSPGDYTIFVNGKEHSLDFLCYAYENPDTPYTPSDIFENTYREYFHGDHDIIEIHNESAQKGCLVVIGDSFTDNVDRLFAENYETVYILDPRHYKKSFREFFEEHQVDDAVFLMASNTLIATGVQEALAS